MNNLVELFKTLVRIDSISGEEISIANFIMKYLQDLGLNPEIDSNLNIYCRIGNSAESILICAHMDTVEPGRGIIPIESEGYLKSSGDTILGADNKASLAAILHSVKKLINRNLNIELLFSVREETDSGIRSFDYKRLQSKTGFVFDGGDGELGWMIQSAPQIEDFKIEIIGRASHASNPEHGINAISTLLSAGEKIKIGRPNVFSTLNIGLINGGTATNTVPEYLKIEGDLRSTNATSFREAKKEFTQVLEESSRKNDTELIISWIPYSLCYEMDLNTDRFEKLKKIYQELGIQINPQIVTSGSDASFLNSIGIETFCLGDGVIDGHQLTERIKISDLNKLNDIIENLMLNYK